MQTTVGLGQGQFKIALAGVANHADNVGRFAHLQVEPGLLTESDRHVMNTEWHEIGMGKASIERRKCAHTLRDVRKR